MLQRDPVRDLPVLRAALRFDSAGPGSGGQVAGVAEPVVTARRIMLVTGNREETSRKKSGSARCRCKESC
jgi:hypothetical protein